MRNIDDDDMSMDDILASIRRYVSDDETKSDDRVIRLTADQEINRSKRDISAAPKKDFLRAIDEEEEEEERTFLSKEDPVKASAHSFSKLQEVKQRSSSSIEQFFSSIIKEWLDKNMPPIVEKTVQKEIEKIKKAM